MQNIEKRFIVSNSLIFLFVVCIGVFANIYGEFLWFKIGDYTPVFWTVLLTKGLLGLLFGMSFVLIAGSNMYLARKLGAKKTHWEFSYRTQDLSIVKPLHVKPEHVNKMLALICLIPGIAMGIWPAILKWDTFLCFLHQMPFSLQDPIFRKDIGFFVFSYPVYTFLQQWLFYTFLITALLVTYIYIKDRAMNPRFHKFMCTLRAKAHLSALSGIILLLIAWDNRLKSFGLLYSDRGVVFGGGYADMNAQLFAYWIIIAIALVCACIFWINTSVKGWKWPLIGLATFVALSVLVSGMCPWAVQKFVVEPNELNLEMPYIRNNIRYTRLGYNLNKIEERDFQASTNLTMEDIQKNSATIKNIKLWNNTPLKQTYKELQEIRLYYSFLNVDEDRYTLTGDKTQVMLSARELDQSKLTDQAQTFENRRFKYTHGYGLCMNPVHSETESGLPDFIVKDIPPVSQIPLHITRPEIYFGEMTNDFVIVKTKSSEFDYPRGDINVYSQYQGTGGVPIGSYFNRLIFSIKYIEPRILLTGYITPESRIMIHRQIRDRVRTLAPFLTYDRDPYVAVSDTGQIFWIQDAYTTTDKYPYSERFTLFSDSGSSNQIRAALDGGVKEQPQRINYIRNSVKVVIDAYNGTTTFYIVDESDPIILTYQKIFPQLFKSCAEMPQDLYTHIRYPRDLFEAQTKMYQTYHMQDPQVFYNKEDLWDLPLQKNLTGGLTRFPMKGYYIIMRLPDKPMEEFLLMVPFTPNNKSNTISWICAQCDAPDYGKLRVYKFPKDKLIYGPRQVEARIDQQTQISSVLTLWSQQGSDVLRGDLLVIPIEESILYIEPVYLLANDKSNLPELKRVIVGYGEKIEMAETLAIALQNIFAKEANDTFSGNDVLAASLNNSIHYPDQGGGDAEYNEESVIDLAKEVTRYFQAAQKSIQKGDWIEYGRNQEELKKTIQRMSKLL